jgi:replication initiation and membrane attachment protein DnaB
MKGWKIMAKSRKKELLTLCESITTEEFAKKIGINESKYLFYENIKNKHKFKDSVMNVLLSYCYHMGNKKISEVGVIANLWSLANLESTEQAMKFGIAQARMLSIYGVYQGQKHDKGKLVTDDFKTP